LIKFGEFTLCNLAVPLQTLVLTRFGLPPTTALKNLNRYRSAVQ
jgi:hypothetical protein